MVDQKQVRAKTRSGKKGMVKTRSEKQGGLKTMSAKTRSKNNKLRQKQCKIEGRHKQG